MKTILNPKTGRMETLPDGPKVTAEDVAQQRRELRDMLDGNTKFHKDEFQDAQFGDLPPLEPGLCLDSGEFIPASQVNRGWRA